MVRDWRADSPTDSGSDFCRDPKGDLRRDLLGVSEFDSRGDLRTGLHRDPRCDSYGDTDVLFERRRLYRNRRTPAGAGPD